MSFSSSDIAAGADVLATQYNNLRKDSLNRFAFTYGENISAGDTVRIYNDSGTKVKKLVESTATADIQSVGSSYQFSATVNVGKGCKLDSNKGLIAWANTADDNGKAAVATATGSAIAYGSTYEFDSGTVLVGDCCQITTDKAVIIWNDSVGVDAKAIVATASGTVLSFGTAQTFDGAGADWNEMKCVLIDTDKILIVYRETTSDDIYAIAGTISGTVITFGSRVQVEADTGNNGELNLGLCKLDTDKAMASYANIVDTTQGRSVVITVSGTVVTVNTIYEFETGISYYIKNCQIGTDKALIIYEDQDDSLGKGVVASVSGTVISYGSIVTYSETLNVALDDISRIADDQAIIAFQVSGDLYVKTANVSGTTVTFQTKVDTTMNAANAVTIFPILADKFLVGGDTGTDGNLEVVIANGNVTHPDKYLGIAYETGTTSQSKLVTILGGIDDNQTGMTPGAIQYIDDDGTVTETDMGNGKLGRALSATEIFLTKNP